MDECKYNSPQIRRMKLMSLLRFAFIFALPAVLNAAPPETSWEAIPPDLPLPASALRRAVVGRGEHAAACRHSQFTMMTQLGNRPRHLQTEFGFNAITVQPPDSHNCDTGLADRDRISEEQFRAGWRRIARRAITFFSILPSKPAAKRPSFRVVKSPVHIPSGRSAIPRETRCLFMASPGFARRAGRGNTRWTARCASPASISRTASCWTIASSFLRRTAGHAIAPHARKRFRDYVNQRFGVERTKRFFGAAPDQLEIPSQEGPLFALWLQWRNRVWAQINESFRARLREVDPKIMIVANTQYLYETACLATDLQYVHEDVVVSESVGLDSWQMSRKMALGGALAEGRPLWNYIGTFTEADTYTGIKPPEVISPLIIATIAHHRRGRGLLTALTTATRIPGRGEPCPNCSPGTTRTPQLYTNTPWARTGVVLSLSSRNALHRALIPENFGALLSAGVPAVAVRDEDLTAEKLGPFHVVTVETAACLGKTSAEALAEWVRGGGILVAAPDAGCYDVLGRKLPSSVLWEALGLKAAPAKEIGVGRGKVVSPVSSSGQGQFSQTAVRLAEGDSFLVVPGSGIEVVPYTTQHSLILHLVRHHAAAKPIALRVPNEFHPTTMNARLWTPDSEEAQLVPLVATGDGFTFSLPTTPEYGVIEIPIR